MFVHNNKLRSSGSDRSGQWSGLAIMNLYLPKQRILDEMAITINDLIGRDVAENEPAAPPQFNLNRSVNLRSSRGLLERVTTVILGETPLDRTESVVTIFG